MENFLIRPFKPEDEAVVVSLWKTCGLVVESNDPFKDIARKQEVRPEWFLLGEVNGEIISSCMVGYDGHRGCVNYLAVHPNHQGNGYGRKIMEHAEQILIAEGCPKINLLVRATNTGVIAFYDELGYSDNQCLSLGKRLISDLQEE